MSRRVLAFFLVSLSNNPHPKTTLASFQRMMCSELANYSFIAARHAEHISILARQKESIHKKPVGKAAATDSQKQQQFIGAQTQWGPSEPRKSTKVVVDTKTKIKTRSEQKGLEHVLAGLEIDDTPEEPAIPEIVVPVKKSAYEIFQRMFTSEKPRKTDWDVFVAAMGETGFEASRSGGSPVSFQPSETSAWSGKGKIVVHRPHPVAELSMFKLVSIGKRMNKVCLILHSLNHSPLIHEV